MRKLSIIVLSLLLINCVQEITAKIKIGDTMIALPVGSVFGVKLDADDFENIKNIGLNVVYDKDVVEVFDTDPLTPLTQVSAQNLGFMPKALIAASVRHTGNVEEPGVLVTSYLVVNNADAGTTSEWKDAWMIKFKIIGVGETDLNMIVTDLTTTTGQIDPNNVKIFNETVQGTPALEKPKLRLTGVLL